MSTTLLREYITEVMMDQNLVRKDPDGTGQKVIRKLVTFKRPGSMFGVGDDVDTELDKHGNIVVDDVEKWEPDYDVDKKINKGSKRPKKIHRVA